MQLTGSQVIIECLKEQGVDTVFGYPGGAILNVYDELYKHPEIKHVLTSHEQGASHAADGYARSTGKVGVCLATSGPGATNLVTGISTAYMDSIPIVAITCNVGVSLLGKDSFQDFTKNVRSNRTVLLPKYLYDLIKAQPHESDDEFIIKMTYNEVSQNFRRFMLKKGIKITFHQLRHLFATSAAMLGVGDDYIQKIGGWSSNTILKSVYTHTVPSVEKHFQSVINDYYLGIINGSEDDESGDDTSDEA